MNRIALLSLAAAAMDPRIAGFGSPIQIRNENDWGAYPDDIGWSYGHSRGSTVTKGSKSKAVQKRRAANKAAKSSRKRNRT